MSVCILECIYSLRAKTESTANVVKRYANAYLNGDVNRSGDTVTNLLTNIQAIGGSEEFKKQIRPILDQVYVHAEHIIGIENVETMLSELKAVHNVLENI